MRQSNTSPKLNKTALGALRRQLKRLHGLYSYREMSEQIYSSEVSHSVLQRLATDKGYTPADANILQALDLIKKPNPYRVLPRWFKRTPEALEYFNTKRAQIRTMSDAAKEQRKNAAKNI